MDDLAKLFRSLTLRERSIIIVPLKSKGAVFGRHGRTLKVSISCSGSNLIEGERDTQAIMRRTNTVIKNEDGWSSKKFTIIGDTMASIDEARALIFAIVARTRRKRLQK